MAEDQENKFKATLIKHKKPEEVQVIPEKKKVVVIKKKVVANKKKVVAATERVNSSINEKAEKEKIKSVENVGKPVVAEAVSHVESADKVEKKSAVQDKKIENVAASTETSKVAATETKTENKEPTADKTAVEPSSVEKKSTDKPASPRESGRSYSGEPRKVVSRPGNTRYNNERSKIYPHNPGPRTYGPQGTGASPRYQSRPSAPRTPIPGRSKYPGSGQRPNYSTTYTPSNGGSSEGYRGSGDRPQGGYAGSRPYNNGPRPAGSRPPYNGSRPGGASGRPMGGRPGGAGGNNGAKTESITDQKKTTPKKFYKTKKGRAYQKKREEHSEKAYSYKKKSVRQANPVPKSIDIMEVITVSELARKMNLKASDLIGKLIGMGMMVTINQQIDAETATILAGEYGCEVHIVSLYDETIIESEEDLDEDLISRPPIVTVMGHVDHGKTKLLDAIRETNVVSGEYGGITQHIGAYSVDLPQGRITFLDTPGHEAFTLMRARGAQITDIVILVVAANDGVMPQTIEAIHHAQEAKVPIIVAINKIDLPEANPDKVKQQLAEFNLIPEAWGGNTLYIEISALKREGISELLESLLLQSELLELTANTKCRAEGKVIEAKVDQGRGIVASVLIQRGILRVGDSFVAGIFPGKVRAMFDSYGQKIEEATPSTPVEILGFTGIPTSGAPFQVTENDKMARQIGVKRQELRKMEEAKNLKKITLANLYDSIQDGAVQELKVIVKGDVHGSVEALQTALEKLSTDEIRLNVIHAAAGAIIEGDVTFAAASNAIIVGFHVRPTAKAQLVADQEKVEIRKYNIIYDAVEDIREAMEGMLTPELREETVGTVEVRETFKVPKIGTIAGCYVTSGRITRNSQVHLIREGIELYSGGLVSLKRFKDDAKEVKEGYECGLGLEKFTDIKVGDILEAFEIKEIARKLKDTKKKGESTKDE